MENNLASQRHSASHVLAAAVQKLYPGTKFAIGPAIENGFYYDFDLPKSIKPEDLPNIESEMRTIIKDNLPISKKELIKNEAKKILQDQPHKLELIDELPEEKVTIYTLGDFTDLCAGPHVAKTGEIKFFKLLSIAGAYWRGDEKNQMLTRIYGTAFATQKELDNYLNNLEEAKARDHKKIGRDLDLFSFHPESPGCPFWHPKGMIIWNELEKFGKKIRRDFGFIEIKAPSIAKNSLWITSGHWDHYRDSMFVFDVDKETYCIKPMDCPFNIKIYQTQSRSYRELPIRYTEIGRIYRHEKSGELNGLLRVQEVTQDDSHIFCKEDQIRDEITRLLKMIDVFYPKLGLKPKFFLSTRPDDYLGEEKSWDKAEADLKEALEKNKVVYTIKDKEGAFYGPKIDVDAKDSLGRSWQVATIQLDFQLPSRFKCVYIDEKGRDQTPVMIHAAIFGSFERIIGILLEHYAGALPFWIAPIQVQIIPVSDKFFEFGCQILSKLQEAGIRADVDMSNETLGKKIRSFETQKIPYALIIGQKEQDLSRATSPERPVPSDLSRATCPERSRGKSREVEGSRGKSRGVERSRGESREKSKEKEIFVSVRDRQKGDLGQQKLGEFIEQI